MENQKRAEKQLISLTKTGQLTRDIKSYFEIQGVKHYTVSVKHSWYEKDKGTKTYTQKTMNITATIGADKLDFAPSMYTKGSWVTIVSKALQFQEFQGKHGLQRAFNLKYLEAITLHGIPNQQPVQQQQVVVPQQPVQHQGMQYVQPELPAEPQWMQEVPPGPPEDMF